MAMDRMLVSGCEGFLAHEMQHTVLSLICDVAAVSTGAATVATAVQGS